MEEAEDLLSGIIPNDNGLEEYRASYSSVKKLSRAILVLVVLLYVLFEAKLWNPGVNGTAYAIGGVIGTIIGASIGFVLVTTIPAALVGSILAFFMEQKFLYKERFKKAFWFTFFIMSILFLLFTILMVLQPGSITDKQ